ncbi:tRNA-specific 2-thiouridylase MnmA [Serratia symbiotica]|nr:tRNA-specific 2-thiouridylase MnmA [Serratia symbiotica]
MFYNNKKKVIVGISGGVDSSVAAYLLQQQGYQVSGLFMKNWEEDDNEEYCSVASDLSDAKSVCNKLGIKLYTINFSVEYWNYVFTKFLEEYRIGRTPNPDILCNKEIKFKAFLEFSIEELGADFIATGHYVRRKNINGQSCLLRGIDNNKDQSYFLYTLNHKQISKSLFPIGKLFKSQVRKIASKLSLITASKKDSTGICFIGNRKFCKFLSRYLSSKPGVIITVDGKFIGKHNGLIYYTLGQRKGLGIGGIKGGNNDPWYVVNKDIINNVLIVAQGHNHPSLMSIHCIVTQLHWINNLPYHKSFYCTVKIRYRQNDINCYVVLLNNHCVKVFFTKPVIAVTPGQSAVFYQGELCLGGGIIK